MEVKSIMKKRILSILLVMSVMASIFALSAATTDAAVKPPTPSVTVVNGGSAQGLFVKWNSVGAYTSYQVAYRPAGNYGCGKGYTYRATANTNILLTNMCQSHVNIANPSPKKLLLIFLGIPRLCIWFRQA